MFTQQAGQINKSLMNLMKCITKLRDNQLKPKQQQLVPFRESVLTKIFQESFTGRTAGSIVMVANVRRRRRERERKNGKERGGGGAGGEGEKEAGGG
jgi:hypothetical protein